MCNFEGAIVKKIIVQNNVDCYKTKKLKFESWAKFIFH